MSFSPSSLFSGNPSTLHCLSISGTYFVVVVTGVVVSVVVYGVFVVVGGSGVVVSDSKLNNVRNLHSVPK